MPNVSSYLLFGFPVLFWPHFPISYIYLSFPHIIYYLISSLFFHSFLSHLPSIYPSLVIYLLYSPSFIFLFNLVLFLHPSTLIWLFSSALWVCLLRLYLCGFRWVWVCFFRSCLASLFLYFFSAFVLFSVCSFYDVYRFRVFNLAFLIFCVWVNFWFRLILFYDNFKVWFRSNKISFVKSFYNFVWDWFGILFGFLENCFLQVIGNF